MPNLNQIALWYRAKKEKKKNSPRLNGNPQQKAVCNKILAISPKKPNSANRKITKARITRLKNIILTAKIPGESHNLQQHSSILIRGAKIKDLIGVSYAAIRGKYDLTGVIGRKSQRSAYGIKK